MYFSQKDMSTLQSRRRELEDGRSRSAKSPGGEVSYSATAVSGSGQCGFTLVEVGVAMLILLIALLGVSAVFAYTVSYNAGNNSRAQALAILQQEVENLRSAKFTPQVRDASLAGGTHATKVVTTSSGGSFSVNKTVDDDPAVSGTQIDNTKTIKEISVTVSLNRPTAGWQTSVPTTVILQRVRGN